jgi:putative endonuclease
VAHGYVVLDRNWRCREGELDLIVERQGELVFCEVKTRSSYRFGVPAEAVTHAKQRRLRVLAARYLAERGGSGAARHNGIRFDVASVMGGRVEVIEAAF